MVVMVHSVTIVLFFMAFNANGQFGDFPDMETPPEPPQNPATEKDIQCNACKVVVQSTLKRLQPMVNQGTKMAVTLSITDPCKQEYMNTGHFNPPRLAKACREWLDESGDVLEEVLLENAQAAKLLPKGSRKLDSGGIYQEVCFIRSHICEGADLEAQGASEYLVTPHPGGEEIPLSESPESQKQLDDTMKQRDKDKQATEAREKEVKRKNARYTTDAEKAFEEDRKCHVCQVIVQEVVKKLQPKLDKNESFPVSLAAAEPCQLDIIRSYNFSYGPRTPIELEADYRIVHEDCETWINENESDLNGVGFLEGFFTNALKDGSAFTKQKSKRKLDPVALKQQLCYHRTTICADTDYLDVRKGPAHSHTALVKMRRDAEKAQDERQNKAENAKEVKRKAWESPEAVEARNKGDIQKAQKKILKEAQQCLVCEAVVKALVSKLKPDLTKSVGSKDPYGKKT